MSINKTKVKTTVESSSHINHMGRESYDIDNPILLLKTVASSCFFGEPSYYTVRSASTPKYSDINDHLDYLVTPKEYIYMSPEDAMVNAIKNALDYNLEACLDLAVDLRNDENIRVTPQVILVMAANHKNGKSNPMIKEYANHIVMRLDDATNGMAYQLSAYKGKPIPNCLKKIYRERLSKASEYELAKYAQSNKTVKLVDLINLVHPKSEAIHKFMNGKVKNTDNTWEAIRSAGGTWKEAINVMGHMALLRNLRNFEQNAIDSKLYSDKLICGVKNGKQLPFRYWSAYTACSTKANKDLAGTCMEMSIAELPNLEGNNMFLCDNSGSAQVTCISDMGSVKVSEIANLTGAIMSKISDKGTIGLFGDKLINVEVTHHDNVLDVMSKCSRGAEKVGQATENGIWLFFKEAISKRTVYDNVCILSDMQAGDGGLYGTNATDYLEFAINRRHISVMKLIKKYHKEVNPNCKFFCIQVAGYQDSIVPVNMKNCYIMGGWGSGVIKYILSKQEKSNG